MRNPSVLVPLGAVGASIGMWRPVVTLIATPPHLAIPGSDTLVSTMPHVSVSASTQQRAIITAGLALALLGWMLPVLTQRLRTIGVLLGLGGLALPLFAAVRCWLLIGKGPEVLNASSRPVLQQIEFDIAQRLRDAGVLEVRPADGLWIMTVGVGLMVLGIVGALLPEEFRKR